jgi:hypothetical protein
LASLPCSFYFSILIYFSFFLCFFFPFSFPKAAVTRSVKPVGLFFGSVITAKPAATFFFSPLRASDALAVGAAFYHLSESLLHIL